MFFLLLIILGLASQRFGIEHVFKINKRYPKLLFASLQRREIDFFGLMSQIFVLFLERISVWLYFLLQLQLVLLLSLLLNLAFLFTQTLQFLAATQNAYNFARCAHGSYFFCFMLILFLNFAQFILELLINFT